MFSWLRERSSLQLLLWAAGLLVVLLVLGLVSGSLLSGTSPADMRAPAAPPLTQAEKGSIMDSLVGSDPVQAADTGSFFAGIVVSPNVRAAATAQAVDSDDPYAAEKLQILESLGSK